MMIYFAFVVAAVAVFVVCLWRLGRIVKDAETEIRRQAEE